MVPWFTCIDSTLASTPFFGKKKCYWAEPILKSAYEKEKVNFTKKSQKEAEKKAKKEKERKKRELREKQVQSEKKLREEKKKKNEEHAKQVRENKKKKKLQDKEDRMNKCTKTSIIRTQIDEQEHEETKNAKS